MLQKNDMKSSLLVLYTGLLALVMSLVFFASSSDEPQPAWQRASTGSNSPQLPQQIASVDLNKAYTFAGERLPMDNFDVRERLDREFMVNSYWHSNTMMSIKLAHRYFPLIEDILKRNGIPDDFKYLAVAESTLRPVVSPAGAKGFWATEQKPRHGDAKHQRSPLVGDLMPARPKGESVAGQASRAGRHADNVRANRPLRS